MQGQEFNLGRPKRRFIPQGAQVKLLSAQPGSESAGMPWHTSPSLQGSVPSSAGAQAQHPLEGQHAEPCSGSAVVRDVRLLADLFVDTLSCLQAAGSAR